MKKQSYGSLTQDEKTRLYYSSVHTPEPFVEFNDGVTLTDPDQGMTLREMVERYVENGMDIPENTGFYDDREEFIQPQNFDLSDLSDAADTIAQAVNEFTANQSKSGGKGNVDPPTTDRRKGEGDVDVPTPDKAVNSLAAK